MFYRRFYEKEEKKLTSSSSLFVSGDGSISAEVDLKENNLHLFPEGKIRLFFLRLGIGRLFFHEKPRGTVADVLLHGGIGAVLIVMKERFENFFMLLHGNLRRAHILVLIFLKPAHTDGMGLEIVQNGEHTAHEPQDRT